MKTAHLAIDLGASSGRTILGILDSGKKRLEIEEIHRFEHRPCPTPSGPVWDLTGIWLNIIKGLKKGHQSCDQKRVSLKTIGVDAWGVDWSFIGESGELLALPHCYRDPQNRDAMQWVLGKIGGKQQLYQRNGIQLMQINSLFQVAARFGKEPDLFTAADQILFIPDIFHFWLSGNPVVERTIASTSGMLKLSDGTWDTDLLNTLGIPTHTLGPIVEPGTEVGTLNHEIAKATGLSEGVSIVAPGSHDTASAIAAVPCDPKLKRGNWAYLSSGTWSLLGAELDTSFASEESCDAPFTNELGLAGTTRFLKNIGGLWLIQELRRELLEKGEEISFAELADQARNANPYRSLIDPNAPQFASPGSMAEKIREFATNTDQPEPETLGDLVRCCLDSLALCYRHTVDQLESVLDVDIKKLFVVGGGTQNQLLNEITAAALNRPVVCGPVEATAIGNLLTQAVGCGILEGLPEIRSVVAHSFKPQTYLPEDLDADLRVPDEVFQRYQTILPS
ncbi:MAG: rhamnulokinase family protein [Planctomycetota bacterium]